MHHYAFVQKASSPIPFYDRTFPDAASAQRWVNDDPRRFFTTDCLPDRYWY